jgi:hypothetical protein
MLRLLLPLLAALAVVLGVACSDDNAADDNDATATEAQTEETTEPEPTGLADDPTSPPSVEHVFDSFHYSVNFTFTVDDPSEGPTEVTGSVEGDFVAPDSHSFSATFDFAGLTGTQEGVIIGEDAWYREGTGDWTATSTADPAIQDLVSLTSADPEFLYDAEFAQDLSALDGTPEERNGVATIRYDIPQEAVDALADIFGEDFLATEGIETFDMVVWLEEASGALVRADFTATVEPEALGGVGPLEVSPDATVEVSMLIDLTQINDEAISIVPPV